MKIHPPEINAILSLSLSFLPLFLSLSPFLVVSLAPTLETVLWLFSGRPWREGNVDPHENVHLSVRPFVRSFVPSFVRSFLSFIRSFLSFVRTLVPNVVSFRMLCQPRSTLIYTGWGMMLHNREQHQHCCTLHFFPLRSFVYRSLDSSVNYVDTNNSSSLEKTLDSILISERLTWIYESI